MNTPALTRSLALGLLTLTLAGPTQAVEFAGSGFLTVAAGKLFDKELSDGYVVADYGQGGIYDKNRWSFGPDSKLGLQGTATFNPQWSVTAQAVSRGAVNGKGDLEWLYATWQATDDLTLQIGRKRLPLFYYSESQDVGLTLPWVRLPGQAYGWDVVNFNGANLIYRSNLGQWTSAAEVFYGNETRKSNPFWKAYNLPGTTTDERWSDIYGADWTLNHDWLELRFSAISSKWQLSDPQAGTTTPNGKQTFLSAAAIIDYDNWLLRSEFSKITRPTEQSTAPEHDWAALLGIGYRFGKWLPMLTYSKLHVTYDGAANERTDGIAMSLRYDLTSSSDIKFQYDVLRDHSDPGISGFNGSTRYGNSKMITIAYDMVF